MPPDRQSAEAEGRHHDCRIRGESGQAFPVLRIRKIREDARRNREVLIETAKNTFAEQGPQVSLELIAKRAGVGTYVLYHHDPAQSDAMVRMDAAEALARVPVLERSWIAGAVLDPLAADMDVHSLHQGFLRGIRAHGGTVVCNAEAERLDRSAGTWRVHAGGDVHEAAVVVNAAGAWCDVVASMAGAAPLGLQPKRRTAFTFAAPEGCDIAAWPTVIGVDESFYFKPEAGQLLGSPANADAVAPQDVQPEEEDVALGIWRIEQATTLRIRRPNHRWAGLRSFVADGDLVGGFDPALDGFFWCAAQGGYGIQTSAAMGETCAALARGESVPERVRRFGVTEAMLSPARLAAGTGVKA